MYGHDGQASDRLWSKHQSYGGHAREELATTLRQRTCHQYYPVLNNPNPNPGSSYTLE